MARGEAERDRPTGTIAATVEAPDFDGVIHQSMINQIHQALLRPETGWDPVPSSHAAVYAPFAWDHVLDEGVIDRIESVAGSIAGKRVLDLGGGPGQYSVAFAKRGADVTWHDVSAGYQSFSMEKAAVAGVSIFFSLGYLENALRLGENRFDLVFCRSCWCYSVADGPFACLVYRLVKPGGFGFVNTPISQKTNASAMRRAQRFLYERWGYKIGHPIPTAGRVEGLFRKLQAEVLQTRLLPNNEEEVLFRKCSQ
jgi:2-polyprenyl-3-methyl-5-hydroxy-6-metoxy-1,4-benzoquinol methylase